MPTRLWHDRARCSTRQGTGIASGRCSSAQNHVPRRPRRASHGTGIHSEHPPTGSLESRCPVGKGAGGAPSLSESPVTVGDSHSRGEGPRANGRSGQRCQCFTCTRPFPSAAASLPSAPARRPRGRAEPPGEARRAPGENR